MIEVEEVVEREQAILTAGEMAIDHLPVAPEFTDARDHVGAAGVKGHRHASQSAGRQAIVAVEPGDDLAGSARHPLVDGVALAAIGLADGVGEPGSR